MTQHRDNKIHSPACERNREPILSELKRILQSTSGTLLEIGSGTGQHAAYFAPSFPGINWQPSDLYENLDNIELWRKESGLSNISNISNIKPAIELNIARTPWSISNIQTIFTANTLHIISWPLVEDFFTGVSQTLDKSGFCIVYGPFNYESKFTSTSNEQFDAWLKARDPESGIRDFKAVNNLATCHGLSFIEDIPMPANNRLLVWQKN